MNVQDAIFHYLLRYNDVSPFPFCDLSFHSNLRKHVASVLKGAQLINPILANLTYTLINSQFLSSISSVFMLCINACSLHKIEEKKTYLSKLKYPGWLKKKKTKTNIYCTSEINYRVKLVD